jgi:Fe-S-cluster containining protein
VRGFSEIGSIAFRLHAVREVLQPFPEVELSEAAPLADTLVFRLMFRLYWLPERLGDYLALDDRAANASQIFHEKKRLLGAFAARKYPVKLSRGGKRVHYAKYLMISALALDTDTGECSALENGQCGVYGRRPLSCRSAPLHYSRPASLAASDLKAFVETAGYRCDSSDAAPVMLERGKIVAREIEVARAEAIAVSERDRAWSRAIVRRMDGSSLTRATLPSLAEVEASAEFGAVTTSMRAAWRIAVEIGVITARDCDDLLELQLLAIDRELARPASSQEARQTLFEMQAEYRNERLRGRAILASG